MSSTSPADLHLPPATVGLAQVEDLTLEVGGRAVPVYPCAVARWASWSATGAVEVVITIATAVESVVVRPLSAGIAARVEGRTVRFTLPSSRHLRVEIDGLPGLYLFADPPVLPPAAGSDVIRFDEPRIHDAGLIELRSGQTLWIGPGAVVRGQIHAADCSGITVRGPGVLLGPCPAQRGRSLFFERCHDLVIEDLAVIGTGGWTLHLAGCERVAIRRFKCIGWVVGSDGIDVMASRDVLIEGCCLHDNDDCIAIKGSDFRPADGHAHGWGGDVRNVLVRTCVLYNAQAGNAMEIGFETRDSDIGGIIFRDIDVIGAHGEGGVFTIHNGDHATVHDVLYEDIRIEHFYDKFIDFRILGSRWSATPDRGHIRGITLRRISAIADQYNCTSLIGGNDADHLVENVVIEDLKMGGMAVRSAEQLHLFMMHARGVVFK